MTLAHALHVFLRLFCLCFVLFGLVWFPRVSNAEAEAPETTLRRADDSPCGDAEALEEIRGGILSGKRVELPSAQRQAPKFASLCSLVWGGN